MIYLGDQQIVEYIMGWKVSHNFYLNNITVHLDFQCKSIERSLIEYIIQYLQYQDFKEIYLEVSAQNIHAQFLLGFQQIGIGVDYYVKEDHAFWIIWI